MVFITGDFNATIAYKPKTTYFANKKLLFN